MNNPKFLIVIAGPTAIGKTAFSIELAKHYKSEIISVDSRQFFREMTIGTSKPTTTELNTVKHHFINSLSVTDDYDAGKYGQEADKLINELFVQHDILFLVGGSGMYINAVCNGFDELPDVDEKIRQRLNEIYKTEGITILQKKLQQSDPEHYNNVDLNNPQRLIRALEICISSGQPYSSFLKKKEQQRNYNIIKIGLILDRELLYERINHRVDEMIKAGLVEEVKNLVSYKHLNALQTVGYKELFDYLDGKQRLEKAIELIKQNTRNFAKRQLTWFRKDKSIKWFGTSEKKAVVEYIDHSKAARDDIA